MTVVVRWSGAACVASGVCAVLAMVGFFVVVGSDPIGEAAVLPAFLVPAVASLLAVLFLALGLIGLFLYQQATFGSAGVGGFVVALLGTMLAAGAAWTYVFVLPHFARVDPTLVNVGSGGVLAGFLISYGVMALGWIVFGIATATAGVFGRRVGVLLAIGGLIAFLPLPSRSLVLSLTVAFLGPRMWRQQASAP